jgi:hypothetical protein
MWARIARWLPAIAENLPRVIDACKAAWASFRDAKPPKGGA